jgi:hypothetical protein
MINCRCAPAPPSLPPDLSMLIIPRIFLCICCFKFMSDQRKKHLRWTYGSGLSRTGVSASIRITVPSMNCRCAPSATEPFLGAWYAHYTHHSFKLTSDQKKKILALAQVQRLGPESNRRVCFNLSHRGEHLNNDVQMRPALPSLP